MRIFFVICAFQRSVTAFRPRPSLRACFLESASFVIGDTPLPPLAVGDNVDSASSSSTARFVVRSRPLGRSLRRTLVSSNLHPSASKIRRYPLALHHAYSLYHLSCSTLHYNHTNHLVSPPPHLSAHTTITRYHSHEKKNLFTNLTFVHKTTKHHFNT